MSARTAVERDARRVVVAPFLSALIVFVFGGLLYLSARRGVSAAGLVEHTHQVIEENAGVLAGLVDAETGERGFIITGDTAYLDPYHGASAEVDRHVATLRRLTRDNTRQQGRIDTLEILTRRRIDKLDERIRLRHDVGLERAREEFVSGGRLLMDSVRYVIADIDGDEQRLMAARLADQAARERILTIVAIVGTLLAAAIAFLVNAMLSRAANEQARLAGELRERATELEAVNQQLQDQAEEMEEQATEMEALNEELQVTNGQLEERTAEAEAANRAKAQFLANMSHDLRTPLNAVIGYVDLLQLEIHGPLTANQQDMVERIGRSGNHLRTLIEDVLDFAKIETGRLQLRLENIPLTAVIESVQTLVASQAEVKGLTLTYACDDGCLVRADRERLNQILVNLVGNAIKFTDAPGRIAVDCRASDDRIRMNVSDTGRGIPIGAMEAVFEPFVQLGRRPEAREQQGVGLGLAISRHLARAMDGDLVVTSTVGKGSTFSLYLPRSAAAFPTARIVLDQQPNFSPTG